MLIAFEGIDNAGKTTVIDKLKNILDIESFAFCGEFCSPIAKEIKALLRNNGSYFLKTYFFASDRAWTYENLALPALENSKIVLWDRYIDSALAYRYAERGESNIINLSFVKKINSPFKKADATIYFDIPVSVSIARGRMSDKDNPYSDEFLAKVKRFYDKCSASDKNYFTIDASRPLEKVIEDTAAIITELQSRKLTHASVSTTKLDIIHSRTDELVRVLEKAFSSKEGLLSNQEDLVENQIPPGVQKLSSEHALFLFYTVQNDHGVKSAPMYKKAKHLFEQHPEFFDPAWILNNYTLDTADRIVEDIIKHIGARYPSVLAKSWFYNSHKLIDEFGGSPINMFTSSRDATILIKTIKSFKGYGDKIGGMLLRAIVGLGFNKDVYNLDKVLVPVDIHDSRIMFLTNIFHVDNEKTEVDYYKYAKQAQRELLDACNRCGTNWLDVDRALWLIGSRGCVSGKCFMCPLRTMCKRSTRGSLLDQR